jgi:pimeloyl-ACP methyl ester carboxylesterase
MRTEIIGRYVEVAGHRLYLDTGGDPAGQPMILIHTAGQNTLQWRFVLPYFAARGYFVVAPDLPGHGKSLLRDFKPLDSVHDFAETVWQLKQRLELERPVVIGCSIGGDITLDLAVHHGSEMGAAVACEGAARTPTFSPRLVEMGLEDSGVPSHGDQGALAGLSACGTRALPERVAEIVWTRRMGDPKVYYHDLKAWIAHDIRTRLREISCPLAVVWGSEDYFVPYNLVKETVDAVPNAQWIVLEGIGHYPHIETPAFNGVVEKFLNSLPKDRGKE